MGATRVLSRWSPAGPRHRDLGIHRVRGRPAGGGQPRPGRPDLDPPTIVIDTLVSAVHHDEPFWPWAGLACGKSPDRYRDIDPDVGRENVIVTAGGSEGLMACALALYGSGRRGARPQPGFRALRAPRPSRRRDPCAVQAFARGAGSSRTSMSSNKRVTPRTRAIVVNSPSNPTGGVFPKTVSRAGWSSFCRPT